MWRDACFIAERALYKSYVTPVCQSKSWCLSRNEPEILSTERSMVREMCAEQLKERK